MHKKWIHINQHWGVSEHTKSKMATSYCCNATRHCKGIHSIFLSKVVRYDAYTHYRGIFHTQLTRFCRERESTFFSEPLEIQYGCQGSYMTMFTFTIVSFIQWELYHLKPTMILTDSWHLSITHNHWITNCWTMLCLQSSSWPSHGCIWRVWSLWQVLPPWYEPGMVHVKLLFLDPGLCGLHSCSLLFVGALDELQHFIWSLEWIEWFMNHCAWWIMLRTCLLVSKRVEPCTQGFNVIPLPIPK